MKHSLKCFLSGFLSVLAVLSLVGTLAFNALADNTPEPENTPAAVNTPVPKEGGAPAPSTPPTEGSGTPAPSTPPTEGGGTPAPSTPPTEGGGTPAPSTPPTEGGGTPAPSTSPTEGEDKKDKKPGEEGEEPLLGGPLGGPIIPMGMDFIVTFDPGTGTLVGAGTATYPDDGSVTTYGAMPSATPADSAHYTFVGWFSAASGGTQYTGTDTFLSVTDHILYAHYQGIPCTVTFENTPGTVGGSTTRSVEYGTAIGALPSATRTGYTFDSWLLNDTPVTAATIVTGDISLRQSWTPDTHTIALDPNGGTVSPTTKSVVYDDTYGTLPEATLAGSVFNGWFTLPVGGTFVSWTDIYGIDGDQILYAQWGTDYYVFVDGYVFTTFADGSSSWVYLGTIISDGPHGAGTGYDVTAQINAYATANGLIVDSVDGVPSAASASEHILVDAYFKDPAGGNVFSGAAKLKAEFYEAGTTTLLDTTELGTITADPTLPFPQTGTLDWTTYANMMKNAVEGGTFHHMEYQGSSAENWVFTLDIPASGDFSTYVVKLYYTLRSYTVTFNPNGGSAVSPSSQQLKTGGTYGPFPVTTRPGYTLDGWYLGADIIPDGVKAVMDRDETLDAHWTPNVYTVNFNANGGTTPTGSMNVTFDSPYGMLPTPSRATDTFLGWFTSASGGTQVTAHINVSTPGNHTLYAHWGSGYVQTYRVTVRYVDYGTGNSLATSFRSGAINVGDSYDASAQTSKHISGYSRRSVSGSITGTINGDVTITVYYNKNTTASGTTASSSTTGTGTTSGKEYDTPATGDPEILTLLPTVIGLSFAGMVVAGTALLLRKRKHVRPR